MTLKTEGMQVKDLMKFSPIFVFEKSSVSNAIEIMRSYGSDNISVIDDDFSIVATISKDKLFKYIESENDSQNIKMTRMDEIVSKHNNSIVLYPGMTALEAYSIMKYLKLKCMPVVDFPWEKRITGYLWKKDINKLLKKLTKIS